jgi:anhydro-N-acetylmuramic acid kinase
MLYRVIGLMSGSSLDGLDIAFVHLNETSGKWTYEIQQASCYKYTPEWIGRLKNATGLSAFEYQLLHVEYGHFIGAEVRRFIEENDLHYQVQLIASHGHTAFHMPAKKLTAQLGDGAAIAAGTGINVISDLRAIDLALGGQGAPIVPVGEKLLWSEYDFFLNLGGIANISAQIRANEKDSPDFIAFDICSACRVLNMLANEMGKEYDENGIIAASGTVKTGLLQKLDQLDYYNLPYPKSLANDFGVDKVYPLVRDAGYEMRDTLRTYVEHICVQVRNAIVQLISGFQPQTSGFRLLATGGGAHNGFLIARLRTLLEPLQVELVVPDDKLIDYKEALVMALIGVLRWRDEKNILSSVTGASRDSVGGAVWIGQEV